ncbi:DUF6760 family protein [Bradyrhizobium sp. HKCCYLS20291]|uniref:DUF6760 family protein n=1 Tax=Bradyrhizobium sp. HKCCYLS20291 TaxID=3420766 RepID=UPI003EC0000D
MSALRREVRAGARTCGGIVGYPLDQIVQEVAFVAYHFHWSRTEIYDMAHPERRQWVEQISRLNQAAQDEA